MESGASDSPSPSMSFSNMAGAEHPSSFFEIDVETALRELAGGQPAANDASPPSGGSASPPASEGDEPAVDGGVDIAAEGAEISLDREGDPEKPSRESSDSDVIYIDLTQRPPPLPMSGLALEQIVSMLPGSTYSVAGSGIPLRTSPRPEEPLERKSPRTQANEAGPTTSEGKWTSAGADNGPSSDAGEQEESDSEDPSALAEEPAPKQSSGGAGDRPSGGGSPRMAFTFIPGLGLVPVVIHGEDEDDVSDGDDVDMGDEGNFAVGGMGAGVIVEEDSEESGAGAAGVAADVADKGNDEGEDGSADGVEDVAAAFSEHCGSFKEESNDAVGELSEGAAGVAPAARSTSQPLGNTTLAADAAEGQEPDAELSTDSTSLPDVQQVAFADEEFGETSGAVADLLDPIKGTGSSQHGPPGFNISEEQLRDIIQQAVHGLQFEGLGLEEQDGGEGEEEEGGEGEGQGSESDDGDSSPLEGGVAATVPAAAGGRRSLTAVYAPEVFRVAGARTRATASDDGEGSDEGEEVVQYAEEEEEGAYEEEEGLAAGGNEVDDSGSGAVDEPGSMLDGLSRRRFSQPNADSSSLTTSTPESLHAMELAAAGSASAATLGGKAPQPQAEATPGSTLLEPVRAGGSSEDAHVMASRLQPQSGAALPNIPRPRYMMYGVMRSYDTPRSPDSEDEDGGEADPKPTGAPAPAQTEAAAPERATDGVGAPASASATDTEAVAEPLTVPAPVPASSSRPGSRSASFSSSLPTPFAGSTLGAVGGGASAGGVVDLNSTMRTSGQSLAAIRQAALQAESERQAKFMAERLGGGGGGAAKGDQASAASHSRGHHHLHSSLPALPVTQTGAAGNHITNPFGFAGHEASAAAGLIDSAPPNRGVRRSAGSGSGADLWPHPKPQAPVEEADLEDLLRDRPIIQPRYPTDTAKSTPPAHENNHHQDRHDHYEHHEHHHHHHQQHDRHQERPPQAAQSGAVGEEAGSGSGAGAPLLASSGSSGDSSDGWRPRHRRSVDMVDLDKIAAAGEGDEPEPTSPTGSKAAAMPTSPSGRSLLATRKSDDGVLLPPPVVSRSPRLVEDDDQEEEDVRGNGSGDGSSCSSSSTSSSAHSVADERLVDELEALREELGQKTTLVAGLRGELRKYTELTVRLEHQLGELRNHHQAAGAGAGLGGGETETNVAPRGPEAPAMVQAAAEGHEAPPAASPQAPAQSAESAPDTPSAAAAPQPPVASHGLPPHPQAQGLEAPARFTLYRDILSHAQLQVGRSGGPMPPDLRDAQELLQGKDASETLDAGTEKVMLIKLQKLVAWGCEAAWKASVAQQQARFMEQAAQQAAQARSVWEAEREQLKAALEAARASSASASKGGPSLAAAGSGSGSGAAAGLQEQFEETQEQLEASRAQVSDLECAVAALNADVRKLRGQLRSSRDGLMNHGDSDRSDGRRSSSGSGAADSAAWNMERQMLLKTITGLEWELEQFRAGVASATANTVAAVAPDDEEEGGAGRGSAGGSSEGDAARKARLAEAAADRLQQLQAERDAATAEAADLRRQLQEATAAATAAAAVSAAQEQPSVSPALDTRGSASGGAVGLAQLLLPPASPRESEVQRLREELAAARQAAAESQSELTASEEQCTMLRGQVLELRQELAVGAADAVAAAGQLEEEKRALEAVGAERDAMLARLQQQLLAAEMDTQGLRAALAEQAAARAQLEEQLQAAAGAAAGSEVQAVVRRSRATAEELTTEPAALIPVDLRERVEALQTELHEQSQEAAATVQALSQALKIATADRDRLQQLLDARSGDLTQAEAQLHDVRAAMTQLQAKASDMQAQVAQLQAILARAQQERADAEAAAAAARADATAAEERACDAHAASLLAETALGRALEEVEALRSRVGALEDENEQAQEDVGALQGRLKAAESELQAVRAELEELRSYVLDLETEGRDLRTALSAEDSLQVQLRGQVECLESELEAQASVAQARDARASAVEAALAAVQGRLSRAAGGGGRRGEAEVEAARVAAAAAQVRVSDLEDQLEDVRAQLEEVVARCEDVSAEAEETRERLAEAESQREQTERRLQEALGQVGGAAAPSPRNRQQAPTGAVALSSSSPSKVGKGQGQAATADSRLAALEEQLRAAESDREAMRREVAALLQQLQGAGAPASTPAAALRTPSVRGLEEGGEAAVLRAEKAALLADCARLRAETDRLRAAAGTATATTSGNTATLGGGGWPPSALLHGAAGGAAGGLTGMVSGAVAEALQERLHAAQGEVQAMRGELAAARAEVAAKRELLVAKDRSLATLQETVDALKVALQVTQQSLQMPMLSPAGSPAMRGAGSTTDLSASAGKLLLPLSQQHPPPPPQSYQDTVVALQAKFEESETTIRRLEKQMATLETRLTPDDGSAGKQRGVAALTASSTGDGAGSSDAQPESLRGADSVNLELRLQLEEKKEENARLLQELELARSQLSAATRAATSADRTTATASAPRGLAGAAVEPGGSSSTAASAASTINDLQMQLLQWRALGEDVHARYQSKKETVRRLREQLAAEQQRHADEQARGKAQLDAACQRLGRLATELGAALRRCIALDLQPLSASTLTTSPRSHLGGADAPEDINALAALLARQGAALIESLEQALDQVSSAREERALLLAQLAHRQVVLDELRHHLARQAAVAPAAAAADAAATVASVMASAGAAGAGSAGMMSPSPSTPTSGAWPGQVLVQPGSYPSSGRPGDVRQTPSSSTAAPASSSLLSAQAPSTTNTTDTSPKAPPKFVAPTSSSSPSSRSLQTASISLAQDMAALSVQQAGLRSTLHHFEQRAAAQQAKARSLSAGVPFGPSGTGVSIGYPFNSATAAAAAGATSSVSPVPSLRVSARHLGIGGSSGGSGVPAGDGLGLQSSAGAYAAQSQSQSSLLGRLSGVRMEGSPVRFSRPLGAGLYGQPTSPVKGAVSSQYDVPRAGEGLLTTTSPYGMLSRGSQGVVPGTAAGSLMAAGGVGGSQGSGAGLSLSHERRLKLGEPAP